MSRELQESKARLEEAQRIAYVGHYYWNLNDEKGDRLAGSSGVKVPLAGRNSRSDPSGGQATRQAVANSEPV
jgi:hypothetical protein